MFLPRVYSIGRENVNCTANQQTTSPLQCHIQYHSDSIPVPRRDVPADMGVQDNSFNLNKGNRSTLYSLDIFALPVEHGIALPLHKRGKNDRVFSTIINNI